MNDKHVETICRAADDLRLLTGGSAFGMKLPAVLRAHGWLPERTQAVAAPIQASGGGCLLVAGSCSVATRGQNEWLAAQGASVTHIEPEDLLRGNFDRRGLIAQLRARMAAGMHCLLTTTGAPADVRRVQAWATDQGLTVPDLGQRIAYALADLVFEVLQDKAVGGLIVAGGETSGAVCRRLELGALRVGRNIEPGVPLCFSLGRMRLPVVLKSGNFGGADFYGKAIAAVSRPAEYLSLKRSSRDRREPVQRAATMFGLPRERTLDVPTVVNDPGDGFDRRRADRRRPDRGCCARPARRARSRPL